MTVEAHVLHRFSSSFYGEPLRVIATGFLRCVFRAGQGVDQGLDQGLDHCQRQGEGGDGVGVGVRDVVKVLVREDAA